MQIDKIFPTSIGISMCESADDLKQTFSSAAMKHIADDGYTGEGYGMMQLHLDSRLEKVYKYVCDEFRVYLSEHGIARDVFDVNIMKSWMQVILNGDTMPHIHSEAHYSFVYYVNIPKGDKSQKSLVLENSAKSLDRSSPNEPFAGMFANNTDIDNDINCYKKKFSVTEGMLIIFPSHLRHWTETNNEHLGERKESPSKNITSLMQKRVCVAGDIMLTYATPQPKFVGLQPPAKWKAF